MYITHEEAEYLEFILEEDLELGSSKTDFVSKLLAVVSAKETLIFLPAPRDAKIIPFPNPDEFI